MVLCAGYGSRLRPLSDELPKPLLPVGARPLLTQILQQLHEGGACRLVVNSHYLSEKIASLVNDLDIKVHVLVEEEILGTAGGIRAARDLLPGDVTIVVNGDIYGRLPLQELLDSSEGGAVLAVVPSSGGKGTVGIGDSGQVVRLRGERFGEEVSSGDYMGVARLKGEMIAGLPPRGCLIGDGLLPHLRAGGRVGACRVSGDFIDIGSLEDYLAANLAWLRRGGDVFVSPSATVTGDVVLSQSVVGEGARVEGRGNIDRCVVLPGARAVAPLRSSLVLPSGRVVQLS